MQIYRKLEDIQEQFPNAVATIGNFDGVHLGHREIFRKVKEEAAKIAGTSVVITFVPHPLKVVPSGKDLRLINTCAEKETLIEASGINRLVAIPFTPEFAGLSAEEFIRLVLVEKIGIKRLVIGYDYRFGRGREGNVALLQQLGEKYGFAVEVLEPIGNGEVAFSSTLVRTMIAEGDVRGVVALLGRHFSVGGRVIHGHHRGAGLGFPTANLETEKELLPKAGVYAVKARVGTAVYDGACNIGDNPTFDDGVQAFEVFLFGFEGDLYGQELRVYFVDRIREERKFPDPETLKEAIAADVDRCRRILAETSIIEYAEYLARN